MVESDDEVATLDLGERLVRGLGRLWSDIGADLVAPDSGAVEGRGGQLSWRVPGYAVDRFEAVVERDRLAQVVLDFSPEGPHFEDYAATLRSRHGRPGRGGFYAADAVDAPFDLAVDAGRRRLTFRAVPGRTVGADAVLPVQFRAAPPAPAPPARDTSEVFTVVEEPPELVGGLDALARRVVYPEGARAEGVGGTVFVQFVVNTNGLPSEIVALRAPDPRLTEAAVDAVRQTRFWPGHIDGERVRTRFAVPVRFDPTAAAPSAEGG